MTQIQADVQRYRVVLHKGNVQSVLTIELDIGAGEQFDALFVESAWGVGS